MWGNNYEGKNSCDRRRNVNQWPAMYEFGDCRVWNVGYLDGNEAYEAIIQDHAFQCALVDIMLPGRDGYSLLPKLKQYEIPVIFLTAKGDIASKIKGLKDGAED